MKGKVSPVFLLFLESDEDDLIGSFNTIKGIESPLSKVNSKGEIRLSGGFLSPEFDEKKITRFSDVKIQLLDEKGALIASFSGVAERLIIYQINSSIDIILKGDYLPHMPYGALSLWMARRKNFPANKGSWISLNLLERKTWLEVSLLDLRRNTIQVKNSKVEIDGAFIQDQFSFLCSLGEAFFGPCGYIGRNLSAFEDCLAGGFGVETPLKLYWMNSKLSKDSFYQNGEKSIYNDILQILEKNDVEIIYK